MRSFLIGAATVAGLLLIAPLIVWAATGSVRRAFMAGKTYVFILGCMVAAGVVSGVAMWVSA